jgi:zinc protease
MNALGNSMTITIETTRPNLPHVLDLVAQQLRSPRFDPDELERLKKERLLAAENSRANPIPVGDFAIASKLAPKPVGHPLRRMSIDETIAEVNAVTLDAVKAHYRTHFGGTYADIALIGDFDPAEIEQAVTRALGDWRSPRPFERLVREYVRSDSSFESIEMPDKPNAVFLTGTTLRMRDDDPEYAALALANYILAGAPSSSRMIQRLRDKEGITYGIASQIALQSQDAFGVWQTTALVAPQNVDRLQKAWREEIDRALAEGFTQAEVDQFRPGYLEERARLRANDQALTSLIINRRFAGRTFSSFDDVLDRRLMSLTAAEVTAALRKHLNPKNVVLARVGSFAPKP